MSDDGARPAEGSMEMTEEQRRLARHALGLPNSRRRSYRNNYVDGPGSPAYEEWMGMVEAGFAGMSTARRNIFDGMDVFWLTREGATAALKRGEKLDPEFRPWAVICVARDDKEVLPAQRLDDKCRCCGLKPIQYERPTPHSFCRRCDRTFAPDGSQMESWAYRAVDGGFVKRRLTWP